MDNFLKDGAALLALGGVGASLRELPQQLSKYLVSALSVSISLNTGDPLFASYYNWIASRKFLIKPSEYRLYKIKEDIFTVPNFSFNLFWYNNHLVSCSISTSRNRVEDSYINERSVTLRIFGGTFDTLNSIKKELETKEDKGIQIQCRYGKGGYDRYTENYRTRRSMDTIFLPAHFKEEIIEDLTNFYSSRDWYVNHSILWKRGYLLFGEPGGGKAQPVSARIITPTGYKLMGDIQVGDKVIGHDGQAVEVLGIYPQGTKDVYEITFTDGRKAESCLEHLWEYRTRSSRETRVRNLAQMIKDLETNGPNRVSIPMHKAQLEERPTAISPYVMGLLLAEGGFSRCSVLVTNSEKDVISKFASLLPEEDELSQASSISFRIKRKERNGQPSATKQALIKYGLMGLKSADKFIPKEYLWNDLNVRYALAQGLIDGDGHVHNKTIEYSTVSSQLSKDVAWLFRSLGCQVKVKKYSGHYTKNEEKIQTQDYYRLSIRSCDSSKLVSSEKHLKKAGVSQYAIDYLGVSSIEFSRREECKCIYVASPKHLYMTEDFVLTHNSSVIIALASMFNKKIVRVDCSRVDNETFGAIYSEIEDNSFLVLEDFDCSKASIRTVEGEVVTALTFDCLLNYLDGPESIEGVVVFITTNHIEKLDPALIRPGRVDRKYQMPLATNHQKKEMFLSFYPNSSLAEEFSALVHTSPMASLQELFISYKEMNDVDFITQLKASHTL